MAVSYHDRPAMLAMGAPLAASAIRCPSSDEPPASTHRRVEPRRPAVDERLVAPGTRYEALDGQLLFTPPADEPHGTAHLDLAAVLRVHATDSYRGAVDMLTRTTEVGDHAPDASIYPRERDPETGGRKLEELAFEIVSEQSMSVPTRKARDYIERGVRRVFCLDLGKRRALEWSRAKDDWEELSVDASIADACFVRPLPVRVLLDAASVDDAIAEALLAKKNPKIEAKIAAARAEAVLHVLAARDVIVTEGDRARVLACLDAEQLTRWMARAAVATRREDVFGD